MRHKTRNGTFQVLVLRRLDFLFGFAEALFESANREVGLLFVDQERRAESQCGIT